MIDSLVDEITYNADSASWNQRIDALSGSVAVNTGSLLTTASFNNSTRNLTFTKGDSSTFAVNIPDASGSALPSGVVSGSSQINYPQISNIPAGIVSGSSQLTGSFVTLDTPQVITGLKSFNPTPDGSTGIAMTNATRLTFGSVGTNRISSPDANTLNVETINNSPVSGSPNTINLISGVNGSTSGNGSIINIQTRGVQQDQRIAISSSLVSISGNTSLSGSLNVSSSLTARGLRYPLVDNGVESFIQTDGAGNLSLQYVKTLYQNIRNREATPILKGTPLYVSGSTGDNADVYIADAGNPNRMPATLIAGDTTLASNATGKGIILGHIEGVDTSLYPAGTEVYVAVGGGWTSTRPTGSAIQIQPLGVVTRQGNNGMGIVLTQVPFNLPNIQTGHAWVGNGTNQPVAVPTSSFGGGGTGNGFPFSGSAVITGSLSVSETVKSQVYMNPQTLAGFTIPTNNNAMLVGPVAISGSVIVEGNSNLLILSQITGSTSGGTIATGSFATTGSNTFIGNQTITGSLFLSSSNEIVFNVPNFPGSPAPGGVSVSGSLSVRGNFSVNDGNFVVGQVNTQKIVGTNSPIGLRITTDTIVINDSGVGPATFFSVSGSAFVSQSISIGEAVKIAPSNPLPSGSIGDLAVSGSSLYFYNGAWTLVV
jgi:hypothetical protein